MSKTPAIDYCMTCWKCTETAVFGPTEDAIQMNCPACGEPYPFVRREVYAAQRELLEKALDAIEDMHCVGEYDYLIEQIKAHLGIS